MVRGRSRGSRESRHVPSLFPVSPQTPAMGNTSSERAALERQGGHKTARRDSSGGAKDGDRPKILMDSPEDADIFHSEEIKVLSRGGIRAFWAQVEGRALSCVPATFPASFAPGGS